MVLKSSMLTVDVNIVSFGGLLLNNSGQKPGQVCTFQNKTNIYRYIQNYLEMESKSTAWHIGVDSKIITNRDLNSLAEIFPSPVNLIEETFFFSTQNLEAINKHDKYFDNTLRCYNQ